MFSSFLSITFLAAALSFSSVGTVPLPEIAERDLETRAVTVLSATSVSNFAPFTQFARAAYCQQSKVQTWSCGGACSAVPGFQPTLTGGDGDDVPLYFVGYWPQQNSVIVSHEGTDPTQFLSILIDLDIDQVPLSSSLFPGVPGGVLVHEGFRDAHSATAPAILAQVKNLIATKGATSVVAVGHSLGGAIAELETVYLRLNLPSSVAVKGVTYGTPRVGNPAWANWFDSQVNGNFNRINHNLDPIPIVPGRGMGYSHVAGEIHIDGSNHWNSCNGNDDTENGCTIASVPNIFVSDILDHLGAYASIYIGTTFCD
ncbi:Alpha/Beta hydrolase protein [Thelephora terrestris]|uniref:Alpha/Beta hydrolase protein n=1 Tax=Thelephora terrestris TaxID=56493 RepID=A0A9P6HH26_9AGAM|nr:Alpha/Beta hydrolase protein [Thelephora terrestris]